MDAPMMCGTTTNQR